MAQVQVKSHGQVTSVKTRSIAAARLASTEYIKNAKQLGYTVVGSCPDMVMMVCPRHTDGLPQDADFCYIVAANKG